MTRENILMVTWDSVRADHMPFHGYQRNTTPTLSAWADDGLVCEDTHVTGVGTPTSFTGVLTGDYAHATQTCIEPDHWKEANADREMLQEVLQENGYYTGAVHANALMSRFYGWDRGWDVFEDNMWTETPNEGGQQDGKELRFRTMIEDGRGWWTAAKKTKILPTLRRFGLSGIAIHVKNFTLKQKAYAPWESLWPRIKEFVETAPEPWFLWVLLVDTHHPWIPPSEFHQWPQPGFRRMTALNYVMRRYPEWTGERNQKIVNAYDNCLRHADSFLDRLDGLLEHSDVREPAWIIHSDHGDELGEHDDYGHRPEMWDTVTRVPLVFRNVGESGRVSGPNSLLDVGATVLDLADAGKEFGEGYSILADDHGRPTAYIENRTLDGERLAAAVGWDGWKLAARPTDGGYDWAAYYRPDDPWERENRYGGHPKELQDVMEYQLDQRAFGNEESGPVELEPEAHERLAELGYLE